MPDIDPGLAEMNKRQARTEVISNVEVGEGLDEVRYEQASFSVAGTIVANNNVQSGRKYMVLVEYPGSSGNYYIVNNDGTLTPVDHNAGARGRDGRRG